VGFEEDVEALKKMLLHREDGNWQNLMFISILGESGVGKYTLVDKIYFDLAEDDTTKEREIFVGERNNFAVKVWYMMPPGSSTEHLLRIIYERVEEQLLKWRAKGDAAIATEDIPDRIRDLLANTKYILVISGVSSKAMLNRLRACLPDDACNGSRVVLVLDIESEVVAQRANSMNAEDISGIHLLRRLDQERSGRLFCARAFAKQVRLSPDYPDEEKKLTKMYSRAVHAITGGHPLAIVLLAGLLRFKERPGQWKAVLQQLMVSSSYVVRTCSIGRRRSSREQRPDGDDNRWRRRRWRSCSEQEDSPREGLLGKL
jgi:ribose 1,5-bisphosphokinase PhnN